jgi:hypothetical protein
MLWWLRSMLPASSFMSRVAWRGVVHGAWRITKKGNVSDILTNIIQREQAASYNKTKWFTKCKTEA